MLAPPGLLRVFGSPGSAFYMVHSLFLMETPTVVVRADEPSTVIEKIFNYNNWQPRFHYGLSEECAGPDSFQGWKSYSRQPSVVHNLRLLCKYSDGDDETITTPFMVFDDCIVRVAETSKKETITIGVPVNVMDEILKTVNVRSELHAVWMPRSEMRIGSYLWFDVKSNNTLCTLLEQPDCKNVPFHEFCSIFKPRTGLFRCSLLVEPSLNLPYCSLLDNRIYAHLGIVPRLNFMVSMIYIGNPFEEYTWKEITHDPFLDCDFYQKILKEIHDQKLENIRYESKIRNLYHSNSDCSNANIHQYESRNLCRSTYYYSSDGSIIAGEGYDLLNQTYTTYGGVVYSLWKLPPQKCFNCFQRHWRCYCPYKTNIV